MTSSFELISNVEMSDIERLFEKNIIKMLDDCVIQLFEKSTFDDLMSIKSTYRNELFEKALKPLLEENTSKIINHFKSSSYFANAASNANLLNEAVDFISLAQWKEILEAFFDNDQIYNSHGCAITFESLFNKSIELDASVKAYWFKG